jgi:hypothetical protein
MLYGLRLLSIFVSVSVHSLGAVNLGRTSKCTDLKTLMFTNPTGYCAGVVQKIKTRYSEGAHNDSSSVRTLVQ